MDRRWLGLFAVLAAYLFLGSRYALETPLWQIPDEPAHYNYVAQIADGSHDPPEIEPSDYPFEYLEELKAERFPPHKSISMIAYEDHQPPAYYYAVAPAFALATEDTAQQVLLIRLCGVLIGALTVCLAWQLARLIYRADTTLAIGTAAFVAFLPMNLVVTAAVNNDPLANMLLAAIALVAVAEATGRLAEPRFILVGGILFGVALATKATIYVPAAAALVVAELAAPRSRPTVRILRAGAVLGLGLVLAMPWFIRNLAHYGISDPLGLRAHDLAVTSQPRTAEFVAEYGLAGYSRRLVTFTFDSFWGVFGWMGCFLDRRIYWALALATGLAILGAAGHLRTSFAEVRRGRQSGAGRSAAPAGSGGAARSGADQPWRAHLPLAAVIAATLAGFAAYNTAYVQHQGRYLFPALVPIALYFTLGLRQLGFWAALPLTGRSPANGYRVRRALATLVIVGFAAGLALLAYFSLQRYAIPCLS